MSLASSMPTIFNSLPLELRHKIYALPNAVITLNLNTKMREIEDRTFNSESWIIPSTIEIKTELISQKNIVALLYVNKEVNKFVKSRMYDNINVRWNSDDAHPDVDGEEDLELIERYLAVPGMRSLMDRTQKNLVPNGIQIIWEDLVVNEGKDLPIVHFYANDGTINTELAGGPLLG